MDNLRPRISKIIQDAERLRPALGAKDNISPVEIQRIRDILVTVGQEADATIRLIATGDTETLAEYVDALRNELKKDGLSLIGDYPNYTVSNGTGLRILVPNESIRINGQTLNGATPEKVVRAIKAKKKGGETKTEDPARFRAVMLETYSALCEFGGGEFVKLKQLTNIVEGIYRTKGIRIDALQLLERLQLEKRIQVEGNPGRESKDVIPLRVGKEVKRVVWVKLR